MPTEQDITTHRLLILGTLCSASAFASTASAIDANLRASGVVLTPDELSGHLYDLGEKGLLAEVKAPGVNANARRYRVTDAGRAAYAQRA
jgi:hypothetical protein